MERVHPTRGFSLIELIIAMALVVIVSAFALPQFKRYADNDNLKTAAREVMGDFSSAKQMAVGENLDVYRVVFNVGGNSYSLTRSDTGTTLWTKSLASFGSGTYLESITFSSATVSFHRRGTISVAGSLTLKNQRGSSAKITSNITGRTYVEFTMQ